MPNKKSLLIYMPTSMGFMQVETAAWIAGVCGTISTTEIIKQVSILTRKNSRIAVGRNIAAKKALDDGFDYLLMVDPDMVPDYYLGKLDVARPFIWSAFQVLKDNPLSVVGVPYCGERPECLIHVWYLGEEKRMLRYSARAALERIKKPIIEKVISVGTGLLLIDVGVFKKLEQPWFIDEYMDKSNTKLNVGQDVQFTYNVTKAGMNVWCNWYSYSGHIQSETLGCPEIVMNEEIISDAQAMSGDALHKLEEILNYYQPDSILEVGPGRSTFVLEDWIKDSSVEYYILGEKSSWLDKFEEYRQENTRHRGKLWGIDDRNLFKNLTAILDHPYDLILIDGPMGDGRNTPELRSFLDRNIVEESVVIIDDVDRQENADLVDLISKTKNKSVEIVRDSKYTHRQTAFLFPARTIYYGAEDILRK